MRKTIEIEEDILNEIEEIRAKQNKPFELLVSDLLRLGLSQRQGTKRVKSTFSWKTKKMGAILDLSDSQRLLDELDESLSP